MNKRSTNRWSPRFCLLGLTFLCGCNAFKSPPVEETNSYYPSSPSAARVIALGSVSGQLADSSPPSPFRRFVTGEEEMEPESGLVRPLAVAVRQQELLVCDVALGTVMQIDLNSGAAKPLVVSGSPPPTKPVAIAVDSAENTFIADVAGEGILEIDPDGQVNTHYLLPKEKGPFKPIAVAVSSRRVYAVNRAAKCVEMFDRSNSRWLGRLGKFAMPLALCIDTEGNIYVSDLLDCRIQVYRESGDQIRSIGSCGDHPGQFARPRGIVVAPNGILYVADTAAQIVQMFDPAGNLLLTFGQPGSGIGELTLPAGICASKVIPEGFASKLPKAFTTEYLIFVVNQFGPGRVGVYAFGKFNKD